MMKECMSLEAKEEKIVIKINEDAELKQLISEVKKKITDLKKTQDITLPITITGKSLKNNEAKQVEEVIKKIVDIDVKFEGSRILGLHGIKKAFSKEIATSETKFHRGSLRSGQKLEYEGSLVILGDVNAGSEVLAGENIVVLGILRGMAHAGAKGNKEAIIAAASIESAQIRIADIVKEIEREEIEEEIKTCAYVNEEAQVVLE